MDLPQILLAFVATPLVWGTVAFIVWALFVSKTKQAATIRDAALHAYHIVEGMDARGEIPKGLSKEAAAIDKFGQLLENQDYKLTDAAVDLAKLLWASFAAQHNEIASTAANTAAAAAAGVAAVAARPPQ
jgi:hypothetical protein